MNKIIVRLITLFFIIATVTGNINAAKPTTKKRVVRTRTRKRVAPQSPAAQVNKEMSILDQIVEQARIIVTASGTQANKTRATAKKQLNDLMKDLDPKIKDVIADEIEIIQNTTARNKAASQAAYKRLIALVNSINAQANVVNAMEEGRKAIEIAPEEVKEQVIAQTVQNVQAAEAEAVEAGRISQMVAGVKSALAAPGRYFFGEERTNAKTAFEVVVGGAVVGALAIGAYMISPETWQGLYGRIRGTAAPQPTLIEKYNPYTGELELVPIETMQEAGARVGERMRETGTYFKPILKKSIEEVPSGAESFYEPGTTEAMREAGAKAGERLRETEAYVKPIWKKSTKEVLAETGPYYEPETTEAMREAGAEAGTRLKTTAGKAYEATKAWVEPKLESIQKAYRGPAPEETGIIEPIEPGTEQ